MAVLSRSAMPLLWSAARSAQGGTLATNAVSVILGFANAVILARWLGPQGRGQIAAAMVWPMAIVYAGNLGIFQSVLYYTARAQGPVDAVFANGAAIAIGESIVLAPAAFLLLPLALGGQGHAVLLAARLYLLVIPASLIAQVNTSMLQGLLQFTAFNWVRLGIPCGYVIGSVVLQALGRLTVLNIVVLHLGLNVAVAVITIAVLRCAGIRIFTFPDWKGMHCLLGFGLKAHLGGMSSLFNERLDQLLLSVSVSSSQLGFYVVAVGVNALVLPIAQAASMVLTPTVAHSRRRDWQVDEIARTFRAYWYVGLCAVVLGGVLLPWAVPLIYGHAFMASIWPAEVLLVGAWVIGGKQVLSGAAQSLGSPLLASTAEAVALVVTVSLLLFLIPHLGIMAAALTSVVAYGVSLVVLTIGLRRHHNVHSRMLFAPDLPVWRSALRRLRLVGRVGGW